MATSPMLTRRHEAGQLTDMTGAPEFTTVVIAATALIMTIIARDTKATRQMLADQRAEIRDLKTEVAGLKTALATALDENLRLLRELTKKNREAH